MIARRYIPPRSTSPDGSFRRRGALVTLLLFIVGAFPALSELLGGKNPILQINSPRDKNCICAFSRIYSLYAIGQIVIDKLAAFSKANYVSIYIFPRIVRGNYFLHASRLRENDTSRSFTSRYRLWKMMASRLLESGDLSSFSFEAPFLPSDMNNRIKVTKITLREHDNCLNNCEIFLSLFGVVGYSRVYEWREIY